MAFKRRRGPVGRVAAPRPIDKSIISISQATVGATKVSTTLITATTACTLLGIRWSFYIQGDAGTEGNAHDYVWWISYIQDGENATNPNLADAASFLSPEQNVLAFGIGTSRVDAAGSSTDTPLNERWVGNTKTMRKLRIGDRVQFHVQGVATETVRCRGAVMFFCKS